MLGRIAPSLMLNPSGEDISTIRRHLLGWCLLGMTPMGLMWIGVLSSPGVEGPRILPSAISSWRYLDTMSCCSEVDGIFLLAALSGEEASKPMRNPLWRPCTIY